jgi:hypothetical protein
MNKFQHITNEDEETFGPGIDLIVSLVAVLLIIVAIGFFLYQNKINEIKELYGQVEGLYDQLREKNQQTESIEDLLNRLSKAYQYETELANRKRKDKPPIVPLKEADDYNFKIGGTQLSEEFKNKLRYKVLPKLETIFKDYDVNVIEIIGHTDEVPVQSKIIKSNLDKHIKSVLYGNKPIEDLDYVSNVELGLIRALSVKLFLQKIISKRSSTKLSNVEFRIYSAGQLVLPDEYSTSQARLPYEYSTKNMRTKRDEARRRIELRFTKLD